MSIFKKIVFEFIKFIILFVLAIVITLVSSELPIRGIEIVPICGDVPVGLPFARFSKVGYFCNEPRDMIIALTVGFLDVIFWTIFLYLIIHFIKKFVRFVKSRNFKYVK